MAMEWRASLRLAVNAQVRSTDHFMPVSKAMDMIDLLSAEGSGHGRQASTFL
jgi:hypothetical protein